jgi:hypothetical protein
LHTKARERAPPFGSLGNMPLSQRSVLPLCTLDEHLHSTVRADTLQVALGALQRLQASRRDYQPSVEQRSKAKGWLCQLPVRKEFRGHLHSVRTIVNAV